MLNIRQGKDSRVITKQIAPAFDNILFDWDYETYLSIGGYGSGKSYHMAFKLILALIEQKRIALVIREVFDTILESCYSLIYEILDSMGLVTEDRGYYKQHINMILARKAPLGFQFHNGSKIIFKGMDKPEKVKSINNVSIVWIEECSELKYSAYKELLGRIRSPEASMHFLLSCNPIGRENWVYKHFFKHTDDDGNTIVVMDENKFYEKKELVKNNVYYHHSVPEDNPWLPLNYIRRLDELKGYDKPLWMVARLGKFGATGVRVLPQFEIAGNAAKFKDKVMNISHEQHYFGMDFGFEESYNAVISCAVDKERGILYIYDEIYVNHITDDRMAVLPEMERLKRKLSVWDKILVADSEDPKAIQYYRQEGYRIRACRNKFKGSRLSNTRKIKRFRRIVCSPKCKNTINELRDLTYKVKPNGDTVYDEFNIDPHTFSALWYALDSVTVADMKDREYHSKDGKVATMTRKQYYASNSVVGNKQLVM